MGSAAQTINYINVRECQITNMTDTNQVEFIERLNNNASYLENCERLTLKNSSFTSLSEDFMRKFPGLENITASQCNISNISFGKSRRLEIFILDHNQITALNDSTFSYLRHVFIIDLSHNQISTIEDKVFSEIHHLHTLNISFNKIVVVKLDWFASNVFLGELDFQHNKIEEIISQKNYRRLTSRFVDFSNNDIKDISGMSCFTYINQLRLSNNRNLKVETSNFITFASTVTELQLNGLGNIDDINSMIMSMSALKILYVGNNSLNNFKFGDITNHTKLTSLEISQSNLETIDYEYVKIAFPNLKHLDISNNSWNCGYLSRMVKFFQKNNITLIRQNNEFNRSDLEIIVQIGCTDYNNSTHLNCSTRFFEIVLLVFGIIFAFMCLIIMVISWKYHNLKKFIKNKQNNASNARTIDVADHEDANDSTQKEPTYMTMTPYVDKRVLENEYDCLQFH
jgi:Leucine-rich repeat (LRR) protein